MRTGLFLLAGILLLGASLILGKLFGGELPAARGWAPAIGIAVWFLLTGLNLWVGVSKAGYSVREELPIFLMLFVIPVAVLFVIRRWVG